MFLIAGPRTQPENDPARVADYTGHGRQAPGADRRSQKGDTPGATKGRMKPGVFLWTISCAVSGMIDVKKRAKFTFQVFHVKSGALSLHERREMQKSGPLFWVGELSGVHLLAQK